jgi:hypothetical protein
MPAYTSNTSSSIGINMLNSARKYSKILRLLALMRFKIGVTLNCCFDSREGIIMSRWMKQAGKYTIHTAGRSYSAKKTSNG